MKVKNYVEPHIQKNNHTQIQASVGFDSCDAITSAGIMKMCSALTGGGGARCSKHYDVFSMDAVKINRGLNMQVVKNSSLSPHAQKCTHMSVGSDSCSTITSAGIMKMLSMSLGGVDGRAYVFVIRSTYSKSVERVYKESDIFIVRHWDRGQRRTMRRLCSQHVSSYPISDGGALRL